MPEPSLTDKSTASSKLAVLAISRAYSRQAGGMERFSYELIHSLKNRKDISINLLVRHSTPGATLLYARISAVIFSILIIPRAVLAAAKADVIHLGDPVLSFIGWLIKRIYNKPIAVTVHGLDLSYPQPLYQKYLKFFFSNFDLYLPISQYAAHQLSSHKVSGRTAVITPGIHDRLHDPNIKSQQLEKIIKKPVKNKCFLFTSGRLVKRKGHAWFVKEVLPALPRTTYYVIAGAGPEEENIRTAASAANVTSRVIMLGRIKDTTLKVLYNTTDAFIQPNIRVPGDIEGFGLVLTEAASCGLAVFAAKIEGIPDAIHDSKNGTLLSSGEPSAWIAALTEFLDNPSKKPGARQYTLENFIWPRKAEAYAEELKTVAR